MLYFDKFPILKMLLGDPDHYYSQDRILKRKNKFPRLDELSVDDGCGDYFYDYSINFYVENNIIKEIAINNDSEDCNGVFHSGGPNINKYITKGYLNSLESLYLESCFLLKLPTLFRNLRSLKNLMIYGMDPREIPESIKNMKSLEYLNFTDCYIKKLPESIGQLKNLKQLHLWRNLIELLPSSISELNSLEVFSLKHNSLKTFPNELSNLKALKELYLNQNSISAI